MLQKKKNQFTSFIAFRTRLVFSDKVIHQTQEHTQHRLHGNVHGQIFSLLYTVPPPQQQALLFLNTVQRDTCNGAHFLIIHQTYITYYFKSFWMTKEQTSQVNKYSYINNTKLILILKSMHPFTIKSDCYKNRSIEKKNNNNLFVSIQCLYGNHIK